MSNQQSQIDAVEHLLLAVLKSSVTNGVPISHFFEKAQGTLMGSNGPGGPEQKSAAVDYLNQMKLQVG